LNAQADIARLVRELRKRTGLKQEKTRHGFSDHKLLGEWLPLMAMQKIEELLHSMGDPGQRPPRRAFQSRHAIVIIE